MSLYASRGSHINVPTGALRRNLYIDRATSGKLNSDQNMMLLSKWLEMKQNGLLGCEISEVMASVGSTMEAIGPLALTSHTTIF